MDEKQLKKQANSALIRLVFTSVVAVMLCVACLCMTTFAWFTNSIEAQENKIAVSSPSLLSVSISKEGTELEKITANSNSQAQLTCQGDYQILLTLPEGSASGYLVISDGVNDYYSNFLQRNEESDQTLSFSLSVSSEKNLTFTARWGIYSGNYHVDNAETLTIN